MSISATARLLGLLLLSSVAIGCAGDAVTEHPDAGSRSGAAGAAGGSTGSGGSSGRRRDGAAGATERPALSVLAARAEQRASRA